MKPTTEYLQQVQAARQLPQADLERHALVATRNRCGCNDCFCCACAQVLREIKSALRAHRKGF